MLRKSHDKCTPLFSKKCINTFSMAVTYCPSRNGYTSILTAMGAIVSHAYLVAGVLPIRVAYPGLAKCLLGNASDILSWVLTEAFVDSLTPHEAEVLKKALEEVKCELPMFSHDIMLDLLIVLSGFNIRKVPPPVKFKEMLTQVALYEFVSKPSAALSIMNAGVPVQPRPFWEGIGVDGLYEIYQAQSVLRVQC